MGISDTVYQPVEDDEAEESIEQQPIEYSGFIIVRLVEGEDGLPESDSLIKEARRRGFYHLEDVLVGFTDDGRRLIQELSPQQIADFEDPYVHIFLETEENEEIEPEEEPWEEQELFPPGEPPSLNLYWRIDMRDRAADMDYLVSILQELGPGSGVGMAYAEIQASLAQFSPQDDTEFISQEYLHQAPTGINVQAAWDRFAAGQGVSNVRFVDVEEGWFRDHPDLPAWLRVKSVIHGTECANDAETHHGVAVLGIVMAMDNDFGVIGPAAGMAANQMRLSSSFKDGHNNNIAAAIATGAFGLPRGSIVLVEVQRGGLPVDLLCPEFTAIFRAVRRGIIVVVAAGNGGHDLDNRYAASVCIDDEGVDLGKDSGALVVGACNSSVRTRHEIIGHLRHPNSSYGTRVNCHAWGDSVTTTDGAGDYSDFDGTSAAAAIIAGAALLIQSLHESSFGRPMTPLEMRDALSNPATGTPQCPAASDAPGSVLKPVGVMPDLGAVLDNLGL